MIKLYGKVFLGFWFITLVVLASWMLSGKYLDFLPATEEETWRDTRLTPRLLHSVTFAIQNMPKKRLQRWIDQQEEERGINILLMNKRGEELFAKPIPENLSEDALKLLRSRRGGRVLTDSYVVVAQPVFRQDAGPMRMVALMPRPDSPLVQLLVNHIWIRVLLVMVISAAICYFMSRFLTRPLQDLQLATARLADGDLNTRITVPNTGGDETTELARDFNAMAARLKTQMEEQKRLIHDVSHELRSPLTRLRVAAALAAEAKDGDRYLQRIDQEIDRLDLLIDQLLAVPGSARALEDSLDLVALLTQLVEDANFEAADSGTRVEFDNPLLQAIVSSSGDLLHSAFENIIRNALHYSNPQSTVTVSLMEADADHYQIEVTDHGPGVPEPELKRLFDAFYRVDRARQRSTGGHGLGLSIAKRAIEHHKGQITARNRADPRGLVISVTMPKPHGSAVDTA